MSENTVSQIIEDIGYHTSLSNTAWAQEFAQKLWDSGDEDAILFELQKAGANYRSKFLGKTRTPTREHDAAFTGTDIDGNVVMFVRAVMDFMVTVPNTPPTRLGNSKNARLAEAALYAIKHMQGSMESSRILWKADKVTKPYPNAEPDDLITNGILSAEDFIVTLEDKEEFAALYA